MRKRILLDSIFGTAFIFFLIGVVFQFSAFGIFDVLDPIGDALKDVETTDIVFSQFRGETNADDNIVLVNIGLLPRAGIAEQINIINKFKPKVVGLDCFFADPKDPIGDSLLAAAIANTENIVLASKLAECGEGKGECDTLIGSNPLFTQYASSLGFANLISDAKSQDQFKTNRTFTSNEKVRGEVQNAFSVELAKYYEPEKVKKLLSRNNNYEVINYRGYGRLGGKFFSLDVSDVFMENFDPSIIKDKIVIFGFLGNDFEDHSWEDKYYTPLNENYAGRTNPDMFGVTIHANIIAMILNEDYINVMSEWQSILAGIFLCFINVYLFTVIYMKKQLWYDGMTKLIQIVEVILILFLIIVIFHEFQYKLNITLGIVAVLLAGDALEVYQGVIKNLYRSIENTILKKS
ncbi:MAG: CHASE2 domain-containing protein [Cytophagales bacterium]